MRPRLAFDYSNIRAFVSAADFDAGIARAREAHGTLMQKTGVGSEFLGWMDLPVTMEEQLPAIMEAAQRIQKQSSTLVVAGIGGSYLGARAVIEACAVPFQRPAVDIVYAGNSIDGRYFAKLLDFLEGSDFSVNVISKSGTTTETAIAFRILRDVMNEQFGSMNTRERIYATTDSAKGALHTLAFQENYTMFEIPGDVGGRFSVLTPVGLLPIAAAGINIEALLAGAADMRARVQSDDPDTNPALVYAAIRDAMYRNGKRIEVLAAFQSGLQYMTEWWKQLFGESEGKDGRGLFPAAVVNTTDLHSMGQYIQDGERALFETFITVEEPQLDVIIEHAESDADELNYLAGKTMGEVNDMACQGTAIAHTEGGVPNQRIMMPSLSPFAVGELLYFFEYAVAVSGYALGVNPFNQPGVEAYKQNMFGLLNKPGFEDRGNELRTKLDEAETFIIE